MTDLDNLMYEFMSNAHPGTWAKRPYAVLVKLVTTKTNADNQLVCCILFVQLVLMKQGRWTEQGGEGASHLRYIAVRAPDSFFLASSLRIS